jgi:hypothetical protein
MEHKKHDSLYRLVLREDKNPMSCVHQLYYDCLGRDPLYPSFYRLKGVYMEDPVSYDIT